MYFLCRNILLRVYQKRALMKHTLLIRDIPVKDIYSISSVKDHRLTPWAYVQGTTVTYPGICHL